MLYQMKTILIYGFRISQGQKEKNWFWAIRRKGRRKKTRLIELKEILKDAFATIRKVDELVRKKHRSVNI